jgi:hypothetical protein
MPNISFWVSDERYKEWLNIPIEEQKELKKAFKKALFKALDVVNG